MTWSPPGERCACEVAGTLTPPAFSCITIFPSFIAISCNCTIPATGDVADVNLMSAFPGFVSDMNAAVMVVSFAPPVARTQASSTSTLGVVAAAWVAGSSDEPQEDNNITAHIAASNFSFTDRPTTFIRPEFRFSAAGRTE